MRPPSLEIIFGELTLLSLQYIIMANQSRPQPAPLPKDRLIYGSLLPTKMPIFSFTKKITLNFIKTTDKYFKTRAK